MGWIKVGAKRPLLSTPTQIHQSPVTSKELATERSVQQLINTCHYYLPTGEGNPLAIFHHSGLPVWVGKDGAGSE